MRAIFSGFLADQSDAWHASLAKHGFVLLDQRDLNEWRAFVVELAVAEQA